MRVIQITDCHLHADPQARCRTGVAFPQLELVVARAAQLHPDMVIVSGDISQDHSIESYALAEQALSTLGCPWHWLAGNHDLPNLMASIRPLPGEIAVKHWRLLLADTHWSGQARGRLGEAELAALSAKLAEDAERPVLLFLHHPPLDVGSAWMDELGLVDRAALSEMLCGHLQVRGIVCGHIHQAFFGELGTCHGAIPVYGTPSTSDQFLPGSNIFAVDDVSQPGFRVIDLSDDSFVSWVERVDLSA
ncbi:metallophosphoesterase [Halomonas halocynthiae]|uniref:metallophosphoesterase n=1 Tax=Halomonas halocynthiae TaxID=176290 RepID=UPI00040F6185|nr:metallophosphoesterase [Halomonas halocynthiae]